ncbi:hypothetical protein GCM10009647_024940 [Streptomyces sanglieri]
MAYGVGQGVDDPVGEGRAAHAEDRLRGLEERGEVAEHRDRPMAVLVDGRKGGGIPPVGPDAFKAGDAGKEESGRCADGPGQVSRLGRSLHA